MLTQFVKSLRLGNRNREVSRRAALIAGIPIGRGHVP